MDVDTNNGSILREDSVDGVNDVDLCNGHNNLHSADDSGELHNNLHSADDSGELHNNLHSTDDSGELHNNLHSADDSGELSEETKDAECSDSLDVSQSIVLCNGEENSDYCKLLAKAKKPFHVSDEVKEKFKTLDIHLSHKVPRSHRIETRLTHGPNRKNRRLLRSLGVDLSRKRYVLSEDEIIHRNWRRFCQEYDFDDPSPFVVLHYNNKLYIPYHERIKFVQYLGNGLPCRTLYSIYGRFCTLFAPHKHGRFTSEEDDFIKFYYTLGNDEKKLSTLSSILGRTRHSISVRLRRLDLCHEEIIVKWNKKYASRIVKKLMNATGSSQLEDLQTMEISQQIWEKVGEKCAINPATIKKFWEKKLSTMLFAARPIHLNAMRIHLVERLYRDDVKVWSDISWSDIAKEDFEGVSPDFLKSVFKKMLRICYPNINFKKLISDIEDTIIDLKIQHTEIIKNLDDYSLQRFKMDNSKKLKVIK